MLLSLVERIDPATLTQNSLLEIREIPSVGFSGSLLFSAWEVEKIRENRRNC